MSHIYDEILARRNAMEDAAKAHKLMQAALREKLQADCPHLTIPGASSCSLCLKVLHAATETSSFWTSYLPQIWGEPERDQ